MSVNIQNPYKHGTVVHQNFENSLNHFSKYSKESLESALVEYEAKANNFLNYNLEQMDFFERECRAIRMVMETL